jgi:NADH-quinone oxidoreductase subunit L
LIVLAVLSLAAGFINLPDILGNLPFFSDFLQSALPAASILQAKAGYEGLFAVISGVVSLLGIFIIYLFIRRYRRVTEDLVNSSVGGALHRLWFAGWRFDWLYDRLLERPYIWLAHINKDDVIDLFFDGTAWFNRMVYRALSFSQNGRVRWYAAAMAIGTAVYIGMVVFL